MEYDKWCSTTSLANIAGLFDGASIPDIQSTLKWTNSIAILIMQNLTKITLEIVLKIVKIPVS